MNKLVKLSEHCWVDPTKVEAIWIEFNDKTLHGVAYKIYVRIDGHEIEAWRSYASADPYRLCLEKMKELAEALSAKYDSD